MNTAARLGDLVAPVQSREPAAADAGATFKYIDLSAVSQESKTITGARDVVVAEAPSRARQVVANGDVLVSTVRPNLNAVAKVGAELTDATASTGFCVLRPIEGRLDSRYLLQWVKTPAFVKRLTRLATGASYPAVTDRIVLDSEIPLPPLAEQRRIADILDRVDTMRAKRREAIELLGDLERSVFSEVFDLATERWPVVTVADLATGQGAIRTGPFGSQLLHSEFTESGVSVLGIDNAVENEFKWARPRFIKASKYEELKRFTVRPGDVLVTLMGTLGRCAVVPDNVPLAINTKHLCCVTLDPGKCLPRFLHAYFLRHPAARRHLAQKAKGAIMDGLNMGTIKSMPVPLVPIEVQREFVSRANAIAAQRAAQRSSLVEMDALFASLQHRAYRGEL